MNAQKHDTVTGTYWLPDDVPEDVIIKHIVNDEVFEIAVVEAAEKFIKPGSVVIDVGACYGQMSILFARKVGPEGLVISFEASPSVYELCKKNLEENQVNNSQLINAAVWDKPDEIVKLMDYEFSHYKSYGCFGIDMSSKGSVEVKTTTLDSLPFQRRKISLIKIDAQGSDLHVMRGAKNIFAEHKPAVIFEYEEPYDKVFGVSWQQYEDFIKSIGYKIVQKIGDTNFLILPE